MCLIIWTLFFTATPPGTKALTARLPNHSNPCANATLPASQTRVSVCPPGHQAPHRTHLEEKNVYFIIFLVEGLGTALCARFISLSLSYANIASGLSACLPTCLYIELYCEVDDNLLHTEYYIVMFFAQR